MMRGVLFSTTSHVRRSAEVSDCGRYRWWLRREWILWGERGEHIRGKGVCCFVMLNPSTADALQDDPTIRRCIGFARAWGYDTLSVRNLFPWRATDPRELVDRNITSEFDVTGGARGAAELLAALTADLTIVAWGAGVPFRRDTHTLSIFRDAFPGNPLYCLGTTKHGHPRHPLYVKASQQPELFQERK